MDDIDRVQLPNDLLTTIDCPMDGQVMKSEHIAPEPQQHQHHIKQESLSPMHMSPQRNDMGSPVYKPLLSSDPLMASNFSPLPPLSSPSSSSMMSPGSMGQPQLSPGEIQRHIFPQQQQQHSPNHLVQPMDASNMVATNGNLILQSSGTNPSSSLQLNHMDINNQTMSGLPSIIYATTAATGNTNNTFILQTAPMTTTNTNGTANNIINHEKKVQIPVNPTQTNCGLKGTTTMPSSISTQQQFLKKIQTLPQILTVQNIGTVGGANTNALSAINNVTDKSTAGLQGAIKVV